jgi:hypothetical protein
MVRHLRSCDARGYGLAPTCLALLGQADRASSIVGIAELARRAEGVLATTRHPDGGHARLPLLGPGATLNRAWALLQPFNDSERINGDVSRTQ